MYERVSVKLFFVKLTQTNLLKLSTDLALNYAFLTQTVLTMMK
jgi:hypothetical protein